MEPPDMMVKAVIEEMGLQMNTYFTIDDIIAPEKIECLLCCYRAMKALEYMRAFDAAKEKGGKELKQFAVKRLRQIANVLGWTFIGKDITKNKKRAMKYIISEGEGVEQEVLEKEIIIELK